MTEIEVISQANIELIARKDVDAKIVNIFKRLGPPLTEKKSWAFVGILMSYRTRGTSN